MTNNYDDLRKMRDRQDAIRKGMGIAWTGVKGLLPVSTAILGYQYGKHRGRREAERETKNKEASAMTSPSDLIDQHWEKRASNDDRLNMYMGGGGILGGLAAGTAAHMAGGRRSVEPATVVGALGGMVAGGRIAQKGGVKKVYRDHFKKTMKSKGVDPKNMGGSGKAKLKDAFKSVDKKWNAQDEKGPDGKTASAEKQALMDAAIDLIASKSPIFKKQKASIFPGPKGTKEQPHVIMGKKASVEKVAAIYDLAIDRSFDANIREHVKQAYAIKGEFPPGFEEAFVTMEKEALLSALPAAGRIIGGAIMRGGKQLVQAGMARAAANPGAGGAQISDIGRGVRRVGAFVGRNPGTAAAGGAVALGGAGFMAGRASKRQQQ